MRTRTRTILAGLVLAAALVGGVAWATIPGAGGTIQGCYTTGNGNLRVVESSDECRNSETAISWNEKGVAGATGAAGPAGPQGAEGDKGSDGAAGPQGAKGDTGAAGTNGIDGNDGEDGTAGAPGAKGDPCLATDLACVGPKGDTGAAGTNGTSGTDGAKGDACLPETSGCRGPKGDNGERGEPGADGANGADGADGADGAPCLPTNPACVGPQGPAGSSGGGGFTTTQTTFPMQPSGGPDVDTVFETSPDWGTLEARCKFGGGQLSLLRTLSVYLVNTTSGARLYRFDASTNGLLLPPPTTGKTSPIFVGNATTTDTHMQSAARFTLLRSATNPDGSASVTQRVFAITGEILPDGSCRATVAQAAA